MGDMADYYADMAQLWEWHQEQGDFDSWEDYYTQIQYKSIVKERARTIWYRLPDGKVLSVPKKICRDADRYDKTVWIWTKYLEANLIGDPSNELKALD